jgi:ABC-2 type transport system permease protein
MLQSASASSTSISRLALRAAVASWKAKFTEQFVFNGLGGYVLVWVAFPVFSLATVGLIYRAHRPQLVGYAVVAVAASAFVTNALYYVGQLLDEERHRGTLLNLFLSPAPRLSWLTGLAFAGLFETAASAAVCLVFGWLAFGIRFQPDIPALVVSFALYIASLWGLGFVFSAFGLILKRSNDLANLLSSIFVLLGGIYYPIALLPAWLRYPAEALPLGYGMEALTRATLHHAGITDLAPQLIPLAGFAVTLPIVGILTFGWIERKVRRRGDLDLY